MSLDRCRAAACGVGQNGKFLRTKPGGDGDWTVVDCQCAPPENLLRQRKKMVSKPMTLQIQNNQRPARNSTQLFDQFDDFMISTIIQNGRAKHEIERVRQERKCALRKWNLRWSRETTVAF